MPVGYRRLDAPDRLLTSQGDKSVFGMSGLLRLALCRPLNVNHRAFD